MTSQNILDEYVLPSKFAGDHDVSQHTVARYRLLGLPWALWGGKVYIHIPGAREFTAKRIRRRSPPRDPDA
jgi:hypothetical protein